MKETNEDFRVVFTYSNFKKNMVEIQEIKAENHQIKTENREMKEEIQGMKAEN